jgi:hypothetical protein
MGDGCGAHPDFSGILGDDLQISDGLKRGTAKPVKDRYVV